VSYLGHVLNTFRERLRSNAAPIETEEGLALLRTARGKAGAEALAARRAAEAEANIEKAAADQPDDEAAQPVGERVPSPAPLTNAPAVALQEPETLEERLAAIKDGLRDRYGPGACVVATYPGYVVYTVIPMEVRTNHPTEERYQDTNPDVALGMGGPVEDFYRVAYTFDPETGNVVFGEREKVKLKRDFVAAHEAGPAVEAPGPDDAPDDDATPDPTDDPDVEWEVVPEDDHTEQPDPPADDDPQTLSQVSRSTGDRLTELFRGSLRGHGLLLPAPDAAGASVHWGGPGTSSLDSVNADANWPELLAELRLADEGRAIPEWQQLHRIGEWVVPHGSGHKIVLSKDMGDTMIGNFHRQTIRRMIPLDEGHGTDNGGHALGWLADMRWGSEGDGLPGGPAEPDGKGPILYGRFRYTDLGKTKLTNEHFKYISPQYDLNYRDKETGREYGPAVTAVAATNNPYLRLRSLQGEPAPEPVVLSDGLVRAAAPNPAQQTSQAAPVREEPEMDEAQVQALIDARVADTTAKLADMEARLADKEAESERLASALAVERTDRHQERVAVWCSDQIKAGVPAAIINKYARPVLLAADPHAEGRIKLGDSDDAADPLNVFQVVQGMIEEFVTINQGLNGRVTVPDNQRPGQSKDDLDAQLNDNVDGLLDLVHVSRNGAAVATS
jgi:hypothetical protein